MNSRRRYKSIVAYAVILGLTACLGTSLLFDWWPLLRGGFGWTWDYARPTAAAALRSLPAIAVLLAYAAGVHLLRGRADWIHVAWSILGAIAIPVAFLNVLGDPLFVLFSRTISRISTGAFATSLTITNVRETVAAWPAAMPGFWYPLPHMSTTSPLWALLYYSVQGVLERLPDFSSRLALPLISLHCQDFNFLALDDAKIASIWVGILSPVWAALTAIPLFILARQVGDRTLARRAVAWWPIIPAVTMFSATLTTAYVPLAIAAVCVFWAGLGSPAYPLPRRAHGLRFITGCLLGLLTLWNFSLLPLLALLGILTLLRCLWEAGRPALKSLSWLGLVGLELLAGMGLVWGLYTLWAGHSPIHLLLVSMNLHLQLDRPYWPWLVLHAWDLILFTGLPVCGLAIIGALARRGAAFRQHAIALAVTLILLVLSGTAQGETGRIWMYFMPLLLVLAVGGLEAADATRRGCLAGGQVLWLAVLALVLRTVLTTEIRVPPTYDEVAYPPMTAPFVAARADFGDQVQLLGYQVHYEPQSQSLHLGLHWQAMQRLRVPYYFSAIAVAPDGEVLRSRDWQPFATRFPTTCWPEGREIVDQIELPLGQDPMPGHWWVSLSAFDLREGQPPVFLPVRLPDGQIDRQVGLGPLDVGGSQ